MAQRIIQNVQNLANRVIHLMGLVEDLSLRSVIARLARLLLEHSTDEVMTRRRWSTQSEMASRLGTVPDVLNIFNIIKECRHETGTVVFFVERDN